MFDEAVLPRGPCLAMKNSGAARSSCHVVREAMNATTDGKALFRAFVACLIVVLLPVKNAAYIAPALYLMIMWWHGEYRVIGRVAMLSASLLAISSVAVLADHLMGRTVNVAGIWLGIITYAPLLILLCESFNRTIDQSTYEQIAKVCCWFIIFQTFVGVFQFLATGNSDAVCGTMGLLDGFRQSITIAQVYFTFVVFGMVLFLVPLANETLPRIAIAAGALICVLAQSGHQTIFFVATLILCGLVRISHIGTFVRTVAAAVVLSLLVFQIYPETLAVTREWYGKVTDTANSPKRLVYEGAISILQEPKNLVLGTGLGQYSSRAALIASNEYLTVRLPSFMTGRSEYFNHHIAPSLLLFDEFGEGSAIAKPYMSAISLPVELGLVLMMALAAVTFRSIVGCMRLMSAHSDQVRTIGFTMMVGIVFFILCCFIENYAEFSQAVFVPFILFIVAGSRARTILSASESNLLQSRVSASDFIRQPYRPARIRPR